MAPRRSGIMLCYPFEEKRLEKWHPPHIIQPKLDGVRCRAVRSTEGYSLLSSELNVIESVPHINKALDKTGHLYEFDGELYVHGMSFNEIVSITSRTVNLHENYRSMEFHIFDFVSEKPQIERLTTLLKYQFSSPAIKIVPLKTCFNLYQILNAYDEYVKNGYEGIIVRNAFTPYERKRSTGIMKFKPKKSDYYHIAGYKQMIDKDGNPKPMLGALFCHGDDGTIFSVGSGMTDEFRTANWPDPDHLIGQLCHVQYQHLTSGRVPRFPVFVEVVPSEPMVKIL